MRAVWLGVLLMGVGCRAVSEAVPGFRAGEIAATAKLLSLAMNGAATLMLFGHGEANYINILAQEHFR